MLMQLLIVENIARFFAFHRNNDSQRSHWKIVGQTIECDEQKKHSNWLQPTDNWARRSSAGAAGGPAGVAVGCNGTVSDTRSSPKIAFRMMFADGMFEQTWISSAPSIRKEIKVEVVESVKKSSSNFEFDGIIPKFPSSDRAKLVSDSNISRVVRQSLLSPSNVVLSSSSISHSPLASPFCGTLKDI